MNPICPLIFIFSAFWASSNGLAQIPPFPPRIPILPKPPPSQIMKGVGSIIDIESMFPKNGFFTDMNPIASRAVTQITEYLLSKPNAKELLQLAKNLKNNTNIHPKVLYWALSNARYARPDMLELLPLDLSQENEVLPFQMFPEMFINANAIEQAMKNPNATTCQRTDEKMGEDNGLENKLWYFREDMFLNSHHWFWHRAYPTHELTERFAEENKGRGPNILEKLPPDNSTIGRMADRRAELWYYIHASIIARYNVERLLNEMPELTLLNVTESTTIPEGYKSHLTDSNSGKKWVDRPPNTQIQDINYGSGIPGVTSICEIISEACVNVSTMQDYSRKLSAAVEEGSFKDQSGSKISLLGGNGTSYLTDLLEASTASRNPDYFGKLGLHALGHLAFSNIMNPTPDLMSPTGVIGDTATTMRDPLFYQWHGIIDEYFNQLQIKLQPYKPNEGEHRLQWTGVSVDKIQVTTDETNKPNELKTFWNNAQFQLTLTGINVNPGQSAPKKTNVCAKHLDHKDFVYQIEIIKDPSISSTANKATVRIFMAPRFAQNGQRFSMDAQRRLYFALDRFTVNLVSGKNTITRRSDESTLTIPWTKQLSEINNPKNLNPSQEAAKGNSYCGCGWPHHLLIPKGSSKPSGADFDLVVMVTNGEDDSVEYNSNSKESCKTAEIYCGIPGQKYPDAKPMGYPFDRTPFKAFATAGSKTEKELSNIDEYVSFVSNMATTKVTIYHNDDETNASKSSQ